MITHLETTHLIESLQIRIDDLAEDGLITERQRERFASPLYLLDRINRAEIAILAEAKLVATVGLFVQKGVQKKIVSGFSRVEESMVKVGQVRSRETLTDRFNIQYWLDDETSFKVRSIISTEATYVPEFSLHAKTGEFTTYKSSGIDQLGSDSKKRFYFEKDTRRILFSRPFDNNGYLIFQAQLLPARIKRNDLSKELIDVYRLTVPETAEDYVEMEALRMILPMTVKKEIGLFEELSLSRDRFLSNKAGSPTVIYTPESDYDF